MITNCLVDVFIDAFLPSLGSYVVNFFYELYKPFSISSFEKQSYPLAAFDWLLQKSFSSFHFNYFPRHLLALIEILSFSCQMKPIHEEFSNRIIYFLSFVNTIENVSKWGKAMLKDSVSG